MKRINLEGDVMRGDPAQLVLGKEEQPAKRHRRLPRKKPITNAATIRYDIALRMDKLRPRVEEYKRLEQANKLLEKIK
jgi:hypothetical protein